MIKFSFSNKIYGSHKNSYRADSTSYCFGKGTTYDYKEEQASSLEQVIPKLLYSAVSPYLYKGGHRHAKNVTGVGNLVFLDIDASENIHEAIVALSANLPFQHAVVPTQNHLTYSNKKLAYMYKYRLVVPCEGISNATEYKAVVHWLVKTYSIPYVDSASWTDARFFAPTLPMVGQKYKSTENADEIPMTVTQAEVDAFVERLYMRGEDGSLVLPEHIYPNNLTGSVLQFNDNMMQYAPAEESEDTVSRLTGRTLTVPFEDVSNTLSDDAFKRVQTGGKIPIGEMARSLRADQRVFCECPTKENHTDETDERYSWLLKTGSGGVRLYCSSDHCKAEHGEYRQIVLPEWKSFIGDRNFDATASRLEALVERLIYNILTLTADYICSYYNVELGEWHEKLSYAKTALLADMMDENALYVMALLITHNGNDKYLYDVDLAGCIVGELNVKTAHLITQGGWFNYLFKPKIADFIRTISDENVTKPKIFAGIINTVATDIKFVTLEKESFKLKPSQVYNGSIQVDVGLEGRSIEIINNSFDEPVVRTNKRLVREGILKDEEAYNKTVKAFLRHWKLPYGSVDFAGVQIDDLPTMLMAFSVLNMYTDGVTNQRHSAFVITAPSGIGKTSLINNINEAGISNDDGHSASVFGHKGLYSRSIDDLKNKLWTTGDELSPSLMKDIVTPLLLGNLTRLTVSANVKSQIDSTFTSFGKVLWGARAYDAVSMGDQATELRNRLFAITYLEEHFEYYNGTTEFLTICEEDTGTVDRIVQHKLGSLYLDLKHWALSMDMTMRVSVLNEYKKALKSKYAGTISYEAEYSEDGEIIDVEAKVVASDSMRNLAELLKVLVQYRSGLTLHPNPIQGKSIIYDGSNPPRGNMESLDTKTRRIYATEDMTMYYHKLGYDYLVIPTPSSSTKDWYGAVIDKVLGSDSKRGYYMKANLKISYLRKFIADDSKTGFPNSVPSELVNLLSSRGTRSISPITEIGVKGMTFKILTVDAVERFIQDCGV